MVKICIPGSAISVSRFIFGTGSLFSVGRRGARNRLLSAAVDNGFTHFDTAPYYGFGIAERDLAPILAANPEVTVTTKVGIYPPGGEAQPYAAVLLRKGAGRILPTLSRAATDFSVSRARRSLEGSLRRLARDHVELLMLHEPLLELLDSDEWLKWLQRTVEYGQVGQFGVALQAERLTPFLDHASGLTDIIQTTDSLDRREADILPRYNRSLQITYGYASAARSRQRHLSIPTILQGALARNPNGAIIVSTTKVERLGQYSRLAEAPR